MKDKPKPIHEIRLGAIRAVIWVNESSDGFFFTTTFSRLYPDKDGKEWETTDSFGYDDLLLLTDVGKRTRAWIHDQLQAAGQPPLL